ncbi:MerR family transcriptional regulator [Trichococcus flocculiformis]|uniref:MerR family transcriptional regulator n=1 Tax=Trichococcus flocculiformis TaxID=82803 RepID=UPI002AAB5452|nr:MerR family transcriptional regulator [Trichococcus flocculiformis]
MKIAQVSKEKKVSIDSLRYYERIGLIPPVKRTAGGIRDYSEQDLRWLDFMIAARSAGVSIEPLIDYVQLCAEGFHTFPARRDLWEDECDLLEERILGLQETLAQMKAKAEYYDWMLKG